MIKRVVSCLTAVTCMFMLLVSLVGCGPDYTSNFTGDWRAIALETSDGTDKTPTLEQLAAANKYFTLSISEEENAATLDMADQLTVTGTWKPEGENACAFDFGDYGQLTATVTEDGTLVLENNGQTMTFERF